MTLTEAREMLLQIIADQPGNSYEIGRQISDGTVKDAMRLHMVIYRARSSGRGSIEAFTEVATALGYTVDVSITPR